MASPDQILIGYYDYRLIDLSVLISILAARFCAGTSGRVYGPTIAARGRILLAWLAVGVTVKRIGIGLYSKTRCRLFTGYFQIAKKALR